MQHPEKLNKTMIPTRKTACKNLNKKTESLKSTNTASTTESASSQNSTEMPCFLETASNRLREFSFRVDQNTLVISSCKSGNVKTRLQTDTVHPIELPKYAQENIGTEEESA